MHTKFSSHWVEYRDSIDLMSRPSNMKVGLCWYKKGTNNKWTYDDTKHLMKNLETKYYTRCCRLRCLGVTSGDEKIFNNILDEC